MHSIGPGEFIIGQESIIISKKKHGLIEYLTLFFSDHCSIFVVKTFYLFPILILFYIQSVSRPSRRSYIVFASISIAIDLKY